MINLLKSSKFRFVSIVLAVAMLVGGCVGWTVAYFTDQRASAGVFTLGNVYIEMTEAAVMRDTVGNLIEDTASERFVAADTSEGGQPNINNYGVVFPGQTIHKDPTIKNTGDANAWVAAKVIIEDGAGDIHKFYKYSDGVDDIDIEGLLTGGLLLEQVYVDDWMGNEFVCFNENYAMVQVSNHKNGKYEFYFIMLNQLAPGESVELFDTLYMNPYFGSAEMQEFREFKITVEAYAVQVPGFASAYDAMTTAFPEKFSDIKH